MVAMEGEPAINAVVVENPVASWRYTSTSATLVLAEVARVVVDALEFQYIVFVEKLRGKSRLVLAVASTL